MVRRLGLLGATLSRLVSRLCFFVMHWLSMVLSLVLAGAVLAGLVVASIAVTAMRLVMGSLKVAKRLQTVVLVVLTVTVFPVLLVRRLGLPVRSGLVVRARLMRLRPEVEVVMLLGVVIRVG